MIDVSISVQFLFCLCFKREFGLLFYYIKIKFNRRKILLKSSFEFYPFEEGVDSLEKEFCVNYMINFLCWS